MASLAIVIFALVGVMIFCLSYVGPYSNPRCYGTFDPKDCDCANCHFAQHCAAASKEE